MKYPIIIFVWLMSVSVQLGVYETTLIHEYPQYDISDTVVVLWSTAASVNDSALIASGYHKTDGGWIAYFNNYDRPVIRKTPVIHLLQTERLPGDANGDGAVNIGDAVFIIQYVFPTEE